MDWTTTEGTRFPLGATWVEKDSAWNFALYSAGRGERYAAALRGSRPGESRFHLPLRLPPQQVRKDLALPGPPGPPPRRALLRLLGGRPRAARSAFEWHCFDPDKVLLDPYAKSVFFPPAFDRAAAARPGSNAGKAPLGLLAGAGEPFDWGDDRRPRHQSDTIIYELHVRGFTNNPNSGVSPDRRGTYAGVIEKIPYLKDLGVTAVELMPVFQYDPQEGSCWGYMPLNFFAPHHGYGSRPEECDQHNEFRAMVKALHAADIEVILDVVYNHTAEGDQRGPVYSFKGIDNSTYYMMSGNPAKPYADFSGTGNTLRCSEPAVRRLLLDSARFWVEEMHVDGFRFDLASVLTRNDDGSLNWENPDRPCPAGPAGRPRHRGALGRRGGVPARALVPRQGLFPVERPLPGRRAPLRARRPRPGAGPHAAALRQRRPVPGRPDARVPSLPERQLRHLPRRLHPVRPRLVRPEAQRGQRPQQHATARTRTTAGTAAGKGTKESRRRCWSCGSARRRTSAACCCWRTARRCSARATSSCRPRAATTTPTTRTTRRAGSTGTGCASTRTCFGSSAA